MKTSLAIFLMICLQVAMSPLCLCYGAEVSEEVAPRTCCHAPEGTEPAPCPHCDQEMPIAATAPVKGDFKAEAPEELNTFASGSNWDTENYRSFETLRDPGETLPPAFAPLDASLFFGVFLI